MINISSINDFVKIKKLQKSSSIYPDCLKDYDIDIYYAGKYSKKDNKSVVIIGTRDCTSYGRMVSQYIVKNLVDNGFTIISGLSYGIDLCVVKTTLDYGGRVFGFSANGLSDLFSMTIPGSKIAERILNTSSGVVFSTTKENHLAVKESYTLRNYVMAGFGFSTIVIEAGKYSGTFHAVNASLDYGKTVYSVPGSIFNEKSIGTNSLIKQGALPYTGINDILHVLSSTK